MTKFAKKKNSVRERELLKVLLVPRVWISVVVSSLAFASLNYSTPGNHRESWQAQAPWCWNQRHQRRSIKTHCSPGTRFQSSMYRLVSRLFWDCAVLHSNDLMTMADELRGFFSVILATNFITTRRRALELRLWALMIHDDDRGEGDVQEDTQKVWSLWPYNIQSSSSYTLTSLLIACRISVCCFFGVSNALSDTSLSQLARPSGLSELWNFIWFRVQQGVQFLMNCYNYFILIISHFFLTAIVRWSSEGVEECPVKSVVNRVAVHLAKALQGKGMALLVNHGISEEKVSRRRRCVTLNFPHTEKRNSSHATRNLEKCRL